MKAVLPLFVTIALGFAASAPAQVYFADEIGRATEFSAPEVPTQSLAAGNRTADQIAKLFRSVCLDSGLDGNAIDAAVSGPDWAMKRNDVKIPFTRPEYATPVPLWSGQGFAVTAVPATIGPERGSSFRIRGPQCNLVTGSTAFDRADLETAISAVLGTAPVNAAEAMKKDKPNKSYSPRWAWTGPNGIQQTVQFISYSGSRNVPGKLQLALLPPKALKNK